MMKDLPLNEIILRKYEKPKNLEKRELIRKICLSLGLLQLADSRDIIVDILYVLIEANKNNKKLSSDEIKEQVEELRKNKDFVLIAVDAPVEVRYSRAIKRGRIENASSLSEFIEIEEKENSNNPNAQQLNNTIKLADIIIDNNGTLDDLYSKINQLLKQ